MDAEETRRPIYTVVSSKRTAVPRASYHPTVTPLPVYDPSGDLACGLNNQQTAEALRDLEHRCAVSQRLVPGAYRGTLQQSLTAKDPVLHARVVGSLAAKRPPHPAFIVGRIDGEFVEAPY